MSRELADHLKYYEEIGRNVSEGAKGTNEIASNISGVATAAQDTTMGTQKSLEASRALGKIAGDLQRLIAEFNAG